MMKQIITVMILAFSINAFSQKPDWGRVIEAEDKHYDPTIIGEDEDAIYSVTYRYGGDEILFEKYDKRKLNRKYSTKIPVPSEGRKQFDLERISFLGDHFVVFASYYDNKQKTYELRAFTYTVDKLREVDEHEIFVEKVEKRRRKGDFDVYTSKNKESLLIHFTTYYKETGVTIEKIKLYNKSMELLVEKEYEAEGENVAALNNLIVDDEGSIYFIRKGEVVILDANVDYEEWSEPIEAGGIESNGYLGAIHFALSPEGDLVLVSRYMTRDLRKSDEKKNKNDRKKGDTQVEGIYIMKVNGFSKETEVAELNKFDQEFIDQFLTEKDIKKGNSAEMNNEYKAFQFLFKDDGGVVFVTEQQKLIRSYSNGNLVGETYYYNDIVAFNFSPEGELIWGNRIPKSQIFYWRSMIFGFKRGPYGMSWGTIPYHYRDHYSYMAGLTDDKLFFIFNDNKKNVPIQDDSQKRTVMTSVKKAVPVIYTVDLETGHKTKEMHLSLVAANAHLKPGVSFQKTPAEPLFIFGMTKKSFRYGKIEFDGKTRGKRTARN